MRLNKLLIGLAVPLVLAGCATDPGVAKHSQAVEAEQQKAEAEANSPAGAEKRLKALISSYVIEMYGIKGLVKPTIENLNSISETICTDIRSGGDGQYFHDMYGPAGTNSSNVASSLNYAFATTTACDLTSSYEEGNDARDRMLKVLIAHVGADSSTGSDTTSGDVECQDGTRSDAGGLQGACSWHGGIEE